MKKITKREAEIMAALECKKLTAKEICAATTMTKDSIMSFLTKMLAKDLVERHHNSNGIFVYEQRKPDLVFALMTQKWEGALDFERVA